MTEKEFKSVFRIELQNFIAMKRSLGFKYQSEELLMRRLDKFFIETGLSEKKITKELCDKWCARRSHETQKNQSHRISSLRIFCRYLDDIGIETYIPPAGIIPHGPKYDSHIYTDNELKQFFREVDKSQSVPSECPYRGKVMPLFFRILYCTGMRVSELRLARVKDFKLDENEGFITIRNAKNHKDRIVPIPDSLISQCVDFKKAVHLSSPEDEYFFLIRPGRPMTLQNVYHNFRRYLEKAGISHTGRGPRVHDFRTTYCVNLLRKWADEEKDLMVWMPYMRTMLGHEGFEETAYYLKLTVERFPYIRDKLSKSFPDIIKEVDFNDSEFY
jgi:integrase/recombinase XerD